MSTTTEEITATVTVVKTNDVMKTDPRALVVEYVPATKRGRTGPALAIIECPTCPPVARGKRKGLPPLHIHGLGAAGMDHRAMLGHRVGHCPVRGLPSGYDLWDRDGLVPEREASTC